MENTKYPIVLVHGMMAKDFQNWRAFRGIADFLRKQGITVYVTDQDGIGAVATNATQLKDEIQDILIREDCDKVNLIAHSKGGVDARYMISRLNMAEHVASLTTLSTPHHGSGLSNTLLKMPRFLARIIAFFTNLFYRIWGDRKPVILQLGQDLTPTAMEQFNRDTPDAPGVYYQSYSSAVTDEKSALFIPFQVSRYCEHDDTDGMVSVSSSQWGNYRGDIGKDLDHFKMAGIYGTEKTLEEVGLFYLHIVQELQTMGF
jgi:triacylglycerol lipase